MPMKGTSRPRFSLGAHLLTEGPDGGAEIQDNRAALQQPVGWGKKGFLPEMEGAALQLCLCGLAAT